MQTLRSQPVRDTYAAFHFVSLARTGKKFQTVKLGFSSCVLHAGNVISSRYPHVTSFVGDSQQFPRICTLSRIFIRARVCETWWDACVPDLYAYSCARIRTRVQCISRSLWLEAIRKLYSKRLAFNPPGETRCWRSAMECWCSYYGRVFDAG